MSIAFDTIIRALERHGCDPRKNGEGYKAHCPAHEGSGRNENLSIKEGDNGTPLLFCFGKECDAGTIVEAIGLTKDILHSPGGAPRSATSTSKSSAAKRSGFETLDAAVEWMARKLPGAVNGRWRYNDAFFVVRFDKSDGDKQFKPFRRDPDGWRMKDPDGKLPLYRLDELAAAPIVWVFEGEKCTDLARGLGLVATSSSHGSKSAHKSDWSPLAGKTVYIIPDHDDAGEKYADDVARILAGLDPKPIVKIVRLPLVNKGDDIAEWLDAVPDGWDDVQCEAELLRLAAAAPEWVPQSAADASGDTPILGPQGRWVSCLHNSLLWLTREGHAAKIRYDQFRRLILVDDQPLSDETIITFTAKIEASRRTGWSQEHMRSALVEIAHRNEYSSLTAWLDSLNWDGTKRLDKFFETAYGCKAAAEETPEAEDTAIPEATAADYMKACAEVLFISGVARAYQPGCQADVMVVLIGPQGLGKSMGIASLCPDPAWFADDLGCDLFDRKAGEGLRGKWLIEFSEFSRINRATLDVVKSFVSRRSDYYRPPYGRTCKDFPRTNVFVGTTNDDHPLHDRENRRFMPIHCVKANMAWIACNRDQLWAEAVSRYREGAKWWVAVPTLLAEVAEKQEEARQHDFWETVLNEKLGHFDSITMERAVDALGLEAGRVDKSVQTRIGFALKSLGYTRKRVRIGNKRVYEWQR